MVTSTSAGKRERERGVFTFPLSTTYLVFYSDARNMARDVHDIIIDLCGKYGQMSASDAQAFVKKLETQRRYSADVWS